VKNNVLPHSLALLKMLVGLRWLIWPMRLKVEDGPNLRHNVIIVRKLGTLPNIARRNSALIARRGGHIIIECPVHPQHQSAHVFHTAVQSTFVPPSSVQIISTLSIIGLQGKKHLLTSPWLIDSAASNHMTSSPTALHDVRKYDDKQHIQIANGSTLPITAVGSLGPSLTNVFVSPDLSANLISVGQLVEENCSIHFDHSGCCVQDQVSGQEIAKGLEVGRLLPLQSFSIPRSLFVGCSTIDNNNSQLWHKKLGHPNSVI